MAEAYRYTGAIERAETHYAKALKSDEFKVGALTGIGYIMLAGQNNSGAFDMFTQAVEKDDSAWKAWLGLASLSDQARNWKKSDELYKKALKSTDDRALVLNNRGVSMVARGDSAAALVYFDMAEQISPNSERLKNNRDFAELGVNGGFKKVAYSHLTGKELAQKLNNHGYVEMIRGDRSKAEAYFVEAIDAHPSFYAIAHKNLRTLRAISKTDAKK